MFLQLKKTKTRYFQFSSRFGFLHGIKKNSTLNQRKQQQD
jgi:hypothetical protein